jgi:hypothetical protein
MPYDALFKCAFQELGNAAGLLRSVLPAALVAELDWATMRLESGELRKRRGGELRNDLLFSVRFRRGRGRVYFLVEHQSRSRRNVVLRVLGYCGGLFNRLAWAAPKHQKLRLPLLVAVVVSNAPGGWMAPTTLHGLLDVDPDAFGIVAPNVGLIVDDLFHQSDHALQSRPLSPFAKVVLWFLRDGRSLPTILRAMDRWAEVLRAAATAPDSRETLPQLSRYIGALHPTEVHVEQFHAKLFTLVPEAEEPVMSYFDQLSEQKLQQGLEQGLERGALAAKREVLRTLIKRKFKLAVLPPEYDERIGGCDDSEVGLWLGRILEATTLDAVFEA